MSISDATARRMAHLAILPLLQALLGRHYFLFSSFVSCFRPQGGMRHGNEIGDERYAIDTPMLFNNLQQRVSVMLAISLRIPSE